MYLVSSCPVSLRALRGGNTGVVPVFDQRIATMPKLNSSALKLSDTHLVILSAAAARDELNVLPIPSNLKAKGAALSNTLKGLLARRLIEEVRADSDEQEWRRDENGDRLTLRATDQGLTAIGLSHQGEADVNRSTLSARAEAKYQTATRTTDGRKRTKAANAIRLLKRKRGTSIGELMEASGWQAHSVRGFLSGTCKKKMGLSVLSEKSEAGERRYRIEA